MYFRLHDFEFRQFDTVIQNNNVIVAVVGRIRLPAPSLRLICRITALFMADCKNKLNFFSPKSIWRPRPRAEGALAPSCWLQSTVGAGGQGRQPERLP